MSRIDKLRSITLREIRLALTGRDEPLPGLPEPEQVSEQETAARCRERLEEVVDSIEASRSNGICHGELWSWVVAQLSQAAADLTQIVGDGQEGGSDERSTTSGT